MTVTFPAGTTELMIPINTTEDEIAEFPETFTALLSDPSEGLTVGAQDTATVNIVDDEGEKWTYPNPPLTSTHEIVLCDQFQYFSRVPVVGA